MRTTFVRRARPIPRARLTQGGSRPRHELWAGQGDAMTASSVEPPPETFNFAAHLLEANAGRPDKPAFIDDLGAVTYGRLDDRARRFAAALRERGVKREERALIFMQDGADWPVAFLGTMLAGIVPVAVNTLLTADDLA